MVSLGSEFPNFRENTTKGPIDFHEFIKDSWCILFSHPRDFTPVCTAELGRAAILADEFKKRGCKMIALSCDSLNSHIEWINDIKEYINFDASKEFPFPIIEDVDRKIAAKFHMVEHSQRNENGLDVTARACFIIGPDKRLKLSILYPATTGRNFNEILRVLDSLQLCEKHKVATGVDWKPGEDVFIEPYVSEEKAKELFSESDIQRTLLSSGRKYLRITKQPDL